MPWIILDYNPRTNHKPTGLSRSHRRQGIQGIQGSSLKLDEDPEGQGPLGALDEGVHDLAPMALTGEDGRD